MLVLRGNLTKLSGKRGEKKNTNTNNQQARMLQPTINTIVIIILAEHNLTLHKLGKRIKLNLLFPYLNKKRALVDRGSPKSITYKKICIPNTLSLKIFSFSLGITMTVLVSLVLMVHHLTQCLNRAWLAQVLNKKWW